MTREEIRRRMEEVASRHGRWTTDNIRLADELYTMGPPRRPQLGRPYTGLEGVDPRVRCLLQTAADLLGQPPAGLRVLDLAPGEGQRAVEFALHGACVTALDAGAKLSFLKEVFGEADLVPRSGDPCRLHPDEHGTFEVVLCAGVLDRLDVARLFPAVQHIAAICRRLLLIDTHVSLADQEAYVHHGRIYWGRTIPSRSALGAAADNGAPAEAPFWLTRPSLLNLLRHAGFTSVVECLNPAGYVFADRHLFAAFKGERQTIHTAPLLNEPEDDWPEKVQLSALPKENADCYHPNADLLAHCQHLQGEYEKLQARHQALAHLGGLLRHLPRACWQAVRRRLPGADR